MERCGHDGYLGVPNSTASRVCSMDTWMDTSDPKAIPGMKVYSMDTSMDTSVLHSNGNSNTIPVSRVYETDTSSTVLVPRVCKRRKRSKSPTWGDFVVEANKVSPESVRWQFECMWMDSRVSDQLFDRVLSVV